MNKVTTYRQDRKGELYVSVEYRADDGRVIGRVGEDHPRGSKVITEAAFRAAHHRSVMENEAEHEDRLARRAADAEKAAAEADRKAEALRSWLEKMDAPPEVHEALGLRSAP